jgi:hypothetical protein
MRLPADARGTVPESRRTSRRWELAHSQVQRPTGSRRCGAPSRVDALRFDLRLFVRCAAGALPARRAARTEDQRHEQALVKAGGGRESRGDRIALVAMRRPRQRGPCGSQRFRWQAQFLFYDRSKDGLGDGRCWVVLSPPDLANRQADYRALRRPCPRGLLAVIQANATIAETVIDFTARCCVMIVLGAYGWVSSMVRAFACLEIIARPRRE